MFLAAAAGCFGESCNPNPITPSILPPCQNLASQIWNSAKNYKKAEGELNAGIAGARSRFWKVFPNGPGFADAQAAFLGALMQKDLSYLMFSLQQGVTGDVQKMQNAIAVTADPFGFDPTTPTSLNAFPTGVDGGIRPFAFPLYVAWVNALRKAQGRDKDGMWAQPQIIAEAYVDKSAWRRAYEDARNWAEFLSSGLDISKYVTPQVYLVNQMESGVTMALARSKPAELPDPKASSVDLYNFFVKNFGEKEVLAAATAVLRTPKNAMGGLAKRAEVAIGTYEPAPSPNPFLLFLTQVTNSSPHNYGIALCLDQYGLMGREATTMLNTKEQWVKAATVYGQLVARFGEPAVVAAAGRLKAVAKDDRGGPRGDPESKGALFWFTALLKDPKTQVPDVSHFLASSYDPRWMGKMVEVRGTVARVELDTNGSPQYATIHFKESKNDRFTAFTPPSDILGQNSSSLVGKPVEIWGQVQDWREGAGVRFLISKQFKVLDAGAMANFRESNPDWMKMRMTASNLVDSPKYLAWKKFPVGSKASYENDLLHEYKPGTNLYTSKKISRITLTLQSIDAERAIVRADDTQLIIKAKEAPAGAPVDDPTRITTRGEETLTINGKKIPTKWECVTRANDALTFTKTWTSDEVPGGLVRTQEQSHAEITNQTYRDIRQTLFAPIDGVDPKLGDATSPAPSPAGNAAPAVTQSAPVPAAAPPPTGQAEFMQHYSAVMRRVAPDRSGLAQAQRKLSASGVPVPDEIRDATDRLNSQQRALGLAMRMRDNAAAEQKLLEMEDTLAVMEKFIRTAATISSRPQTAR